MEHRHVPGLAEFIVKEHPRMGDVYDPKGHGLDELSEFTIPVQDQQVNANIVLTDYEHTDLRKLILLPGQHNLDEASIHEFLLSGRLTMHLPPQLVQKPQNPFTEITFDIPEVQQESLLNQIIAFRHHPSLTGGVFGIVLDPQGVSHVLIGKANPDKHETNVVHAKAEQEKLTQVSFRKYQMPRRS